MHLAVVLARSTQVVIVGEVRGTKGPLANEGLVCLLVEELAGEVELLVRAVDQPPDFELDCLLELTLGVLVVSQGGLVVSHLKVVVIHGVVLLKMLIFIKLLLQG